MYNYTVEIYRKKWKFRYKSI